MICTSLRAVLWLTEHAQAGNSSIYSSRYVLNVRIYGTNDCVTVCIA
jgi:2-iminoacetate synthase ThiH